MLYGAPTFDENVKKKKKKKEKSALYESLSVIELCVPDQPPESHRVLCRRDALAWTPRDQVRRVLSPEPLL